MKTLRTFAIAGLTLSVLAADPARANITPQAKAVLDRFVEVSGGRTALEKTHAMHLKGVLLAFGLKGTVEIWREEPDKRASDIAIGPLKIRDWSNAGKSWHTDPSSGNLLARDGKDLEDAIAGTWFETLRWLDSDQGGGSIEVGSDAQDTLGSFTVLQVTPPSGKPRQLEFDQKTGVLVRTISKHDQLTVVSTNSDYRKVEGWMVPFRVVQEVIGAAANTATTIFDTVEFLADIPQDRFTPPLSSDASAVAWLKAPGIARIPFEYRGHHVWLHASVNGGPPADFIYDTGASISVLDSSYAAQIGIQSIGSIQAQGGAAGGNAAFATLGRLRIASPDTDGVELHDLKAAVVDLNTTFAPFFWRDCAGIIGFNVIEQFVNRIDFDARQLEFYDPKTFAYRGKGAALAMTLAGTTPLVPIEVDGQYEGGARIDVGSGSGLDLHTPFVRKHGLIEKAVKRVTITDAGIGGTFESQCARMKSVEIGPYKIRDPLVGLSTTDRGALASEDYAGNIGNGLLDRFVLTIDYARRQIWLEPGARYGLRPSFSRFGAQLLKYGDDVKAAQVLAGFPAAQAGLREGDTVTAIDGKPIGRIDPDLLDRQLEDGAPGSKIALTLARDGKEKTLTIKLRDIL